MFGSEDKVGYSYLGNSGLRVSNICLGAMTFGRTNEGLFAWFANNPKQLDEDGAHKVMDRFVELGGNFIDTANMYSNGMSEEIVGTWLKKKNRSEVIIATKCRFGLNTNDKNCFGLSRHAIMTNCDDSLARLQTSYIDLFQAHLWDNATPVEETLRAFDDLVKCGKIRYYGFSNVCGWQLQKIVETARRLNLNMPVTLQQQYNLLRRFSEWEEFMVCENEGIGVLPWSPLRGGMLTGKFKRDETPDKQASRTGYMQSMKEEGKMTTSNWEDFANDDSYWKLIGVMETIAKAHGKTVAQVAIRWLLQRKVVASVIIGATSVKQLEDNMGASVGWTLTDEQMKELTDAAPLLKPYPYDFIWGRGQADRDNPYKK